MTAIENKTAIDFVTHIMEKGGPVMQLFVLHCLESMSSIILKNQNEFPPHVTQNITKEQWIKAAYCVQEQFELYALPQKEKLE